MTDDYTLGLVRSALEDIERPDASLAAAYRRAIRVARLRSDWEAVYWLSMELDNRGDPEVRRRRFAEVAPYFSGEELKAFAVGLQERQFLPAAALETAWTPGGLADGRPASVRLNAENDEYGFGWFITAFAGHRLMTHGGGITGFSANLYHFPDERLTIAVVAKAKGRDDGAAPVDPLARRISAAYFTWADRRPTSR